MELWRNLLFVYLVIEILGRRNLAESGETTPTTDQSTTYTSQPNDKQTEVELDLSTRKSTQHWYYFESENGRLAFYVCKPKCVFNKVMLKATASNYQALNLKYQDKVFWEAGVGDQANNDKIYSRFVTVSGPNQIRTCVQIVKDDWTTVQWHTGFWFTGWNKLEPMDEALRNKHCRTLKVSFNGDSNKEKDQENKSQYEVYQYKVFEYYYNWNNILFLGIPSHHTFFFYGLNIPSSATCSAIELGGRTVWPLTKEDKNSTSQPRAVYWGISGDLYLVLDNPDQAELCFRAYRLSNGLYAQVDHKLEPVTVALWDNKQATKEYEYGKDKDGKTHTWTAKPGFGFSKIRWLGLWLHVMRADRNIWHIQSVAGMAHKVVDRDLGTWKHDIELCLYSGKCLRYHRPAWGSRWAYKGYAMYLQRQPDLVEPELPKELSLIGRDKKPIPASQYKVAKYLESGSPSGYVIKLADATQCAELRIGDQVVWPNPNAQGQGSASGTLTTVYVNASLTYLWLAVKDTSDTKSQGPSAAAYRLFGDGSRWLPWWRGNPDLVALNLKHLTDKKGMQPMKSLDCLQLIPKPDDTKHGPTWVCLPKDDALITSISNGDHKLVGSNQVCPHNLIDRVFYVRFGQDSKRLFGRRLDGSFFKLVKVKEGRYSKFWETRRHYDEFKYPWVKEVRKNIVYADEREGHMPSRLRLKTEGSLWLNDLSQYQVREHAWYSADENAHSTHTVGYDYQFMAGAKCLEVSVSIEESDDCHTVWRHDPDVHGDYWPRVVYYHSPSYEGAHQYLTVYLAAEWYYKFELKDNKWEETEKKEERPAPIELDLSTAKSEDRWDCYAAQVDGKATTRLYLAKPGLVFGKLKLGDKVWLPNIASNLMTEVLVKPPEAGDQKKTTDSELDITLLLVDGTRKKIKEAEFTKDTTTASGTPESTPSVVPESTPSSTGGTAQNQSGT